MTDRMRAWARLLALALILPAPGLGQAPDAIDDPPGYGVPAPILGEPIYEGGLRKNRGIHIPVNLRTRPERRLSVGYTVSNSYLNPAELVCADRSCQLEYESDHTGNLWFFAWREPLLERFELGVTIGSYAMKKIPDLAFVHRLASDSVLRAFHEDLLREESLPVLSGASDGRQVFTMTDLAGRRLTLAPGHRYALPLRLDLTRYFALRETPRVGMHLNVAAHLAHPLEGDIDLAAGQTALSRGLDFGLSVDFVRSRRLTDNLASTFHAQVARFKHDVHVVNPSSPLHGDDNTRSQYALSFGLRFNGSFGGRAPCSVGMSQIATTAHFDKDRYWTIDRRVFEGGNNLRGAILGANDYGVLHFACEYRKRRFQVAIVEDIAGLSQILSDDGSGTSYDPDLAIGVTVSWSPGAERRSAN